MITITKENVKEVGSCNFCTRGMLEKIKFGVIYPYKKVFVLRGNSLVVTICEECLKILKKFK